MAIRSPDAESLRADTKAYVGADGIIANAIRDVGPRPIRTEKTVRDGAYLEVSIDDGLSVQVASPEPANEPKAAALDLQQRSDTTDHAHVAQPDAVEEREVVDHNLTKSWAQPEHRDPHREREQWRDGQMAPGDEDYPTLGAPLRQAALQLGEVERAAVKEVSAQAMKLKARADAVETAGLRAALEHLHVSTHRSRAQFVSRLCGYAFAVMAGLACFSWLMNKLCGENSCWYKWPFCLRLRLSAGLDLAPTFTINVQVHRAKGLLQQGQPLVIGLFPRKPRQKGKPCKETDKLGVCTGTSTDLKWEQSLKVEVEQGCECIQVCAFKKPLVGSSTLIGYDTIKVKDLIKPGIECNNIKFFLATKDGQAMGSVNLTIIPPVMKKTKGGVAQEEAPTTSVPNVKGLSDNDALKVYKQALSGPLKLDNHNGDFCLFYFFVEQKKDVFIWSWYDEREPAHGAKPLGRIPLLSISTIYEVPHSISEFVVRYRDAHDQATDMTLERHDRPREWWVKTMHNMLQLLRDLRRHKRRGSSTPTKGESSGGNASAGTESDNGEDSA